MSIFAIFSQSCQSCNIFSYLTWLSNDNSVCLLSDNKLYSQLLQTNLLLEMLMQLCFPLNVGYALFYVLADFSWCISLTRMKPNTRGRYENYFSFHTALSHQKELGGHFKRPLNNLTVMERSGLLIYSCTTDPPSPHLSDLLILAFAMIMTKL